MNNHIDHRVEAKRVIGIVKRDLVLPDGTLGLEKSGGEIRPFNIFSDLGDFLPFLLHFGEVEFVEEQINLLKANMGKDMILHSQFPTLGLSGLAKTYEYTDLLLGLTDYYLFKQDEDSRKLLIDVADKAIEIFHLDKRPASFYKISWSMRLPVVDTRDGTLIECFIDISNATGDKKYSEVALNIYKHLFNNSFYKEHKLLPTFFTASWLSPFLRNKKFREAQICKSNTNTLFALLSLYKNKKNKEVKEKIFELLDSVNRKANKNGGIYEIYRPDGKNQYALSLTPSFAMLDLLCDVYKVFGRDKDIKFAREIADFWLKQQGKTGLLPLISGTKGSFIDSETDMAVALQKLFELTGEERYKRHSESIFDGLLHFHGKFDYALSVHIDTGELLSDAQRTKFLTLFLKLLILKEKLLAGESIYENQALFDVLRDR